MTRAARCRAAYKEFRGFGRSATGRDGTFRIVTLKPGPLPAPDGGMEAPHMDVSVFARGMLDRCVTRLYFPDEEAANAADPVAAPRCPRTAGRTLIAEAVEDGQFSWDIHLQGRSETVFFDV